MLIDIYQEWVPKKSSVERRFILKIYNDEVYYIREYDAIGSVLNRSGFFKFKSWIKSNEATSSEWQDFIRDGAGHDLPLWIKRRLKARPEHQ